MFHSSRTNLVGQIDLASLTKNQHRVFSLYISSQNIKAGDKLPSGARYFSIRNEKGVDVQYYFCLMRNVVFKGTLDLSSTSEINKNDREEFFNQAKTKLLITSGYRAVTRDGVDYVYLLSHTIQAVEKFGTYKYRLIDNSHDGAIGHGGFASVGEMRGVWKLNIYDEESAFTYYPHDRRDWLIKVADQDQDSYHARGEHDILRKLNVFATKGLVERVVDHHATSALTIRWHEGIDMQVLLDDRKRKPGVYQRMSLHIGMVRSVDHNRLRGFLHRDIKPANFVAFLHRNGDFTNVKLIDFNLATEMSAPRTGARMPGSLLYCAPEVLSGEPNSRSDLFSLGLAVGELWENKSLKHHCDQCKKIGYDKYASYFTQLRATQQVIDFDMFDEIEFPGDEARQQYYKESLQRSIIGLVKFNPYARSDLTVVLVELEALRLELYKEMYHVEVEHQSLFDDAHAKAVKMINKINLFLQDKRTIEQQSSELECQLLNGFSNLKVCADDAINRKVIRLVVDVLSQKLFAECFTLSALMTVTSESFKVFNHALAVFREQFSKMSASPIANNEYQQRNVFNKFSKVNADLQNYTLQIDDLPILTSKLHKLAGKFKRVYAISEQPSVRFSAN